jgi:tRNA threonylcarbamoyladenosine biosynthesis protein TsaB
MAVILAIDTSTAVAGFALIAPDGRMLTRTLESADGHAHKLFPEIDALLAQGGVRVADVDCFAAAAGPGSFTGVRVALAAMKGLAHALGRPVCAVSNLLALAWFGSAALRAVMIDARRNEVYTAVYDSALRVVQAEAVLPYGRFVAGLPDGVERIGVGGRVPEQPLAVAVARIAEARHAAGESVDAAVPDANYVRPPDIREPGTSR